MEITDQEAIKAAFLLQKQSIIDRRTERLVVRKERLKALQKWIHANRPAIHAAMYADFRKNPTEVDGIELFHVLSEIKVATVNLYRWTAPKKVDAPLPFLGTRSWLQYEPKGACLIIAPWNYPFSLCIGPLISALAAGNNVILKPSELTPHVSALIKKMADEIFDPEVVTVFQGDAKTSQELLTYPFNHIFFTGSPAIGKVVMRAAAKNLTSITLELGGKSPTIVTASANLKDAALRTAVAKFVNNGQTCVAPDYVLVDEKVADEFVNKLMDVVNARFVEKGESMATSKYYCRIVNQSHFTRLANLVEEAKDKGARVAWGGEMRSEENFIHPTIITHVDLNSSIMEEEIFGPILPIVVYKNLDDAIQIINQKPTPLALYVFTTKEKEQQKIISETSAGGVCINDCGIHFLHHNLPFGGVKNSGMGSSHGHYGFLAFSNEKPIMKQRNGFTSFQAFYPPYTTITSRMMNWFLKLF